MNNFGSTAPSSRPPAGRQILVPVLWVTLLFGAWPQKLQAYQDQDAQAPPQTSQAQPYAQQTPEQLQQLVARIALYPDSLVAQILAASTFPDQVMEADRWVEAHPGLQGEALGQAVDSELWDPSVKALTAFPSVLGNMDKNLSWTSSWFTYLPMIPGWFTEVPSWRGRDGIRIREFGMTAHTLPTLWGFQARGRSVERHVGPPKFDSAAFRFRRLHAVNGS